MKFAKQSIIIIIVSVGLLGLFWIVVGNNITKPATTWAISEYQSGYPGPSSPTPDIPSGYPGPNQSVPAPGATPTFSPDVLHVTTQLTLSRAQGVPGTDPYTPEVKLISPGQGEMPEIQFEAVTLEYYGPLPSAIPSSSIPQPNSDLVDNWENLLNDGFEGSFPPSGCVVFDDNGGEEHLWDKDDFRPFQGVFGAWPARGGTDGVDPANTNYPSNYG